MKALINPAQNNLVVEVTANEFEVASPLYWVDCTSSIVAYQYTYDGSQFVPYTPPVVTATADENKTTAINLLNETDWATRGSVSDPAISNPYLTNQDAFFAFQNTVRQYAINPVAGNIDWPVQPTATWSN